MSEIAEIAGIAADVEAVKERTDATAAQARISASVRLI